MPPGAMSQWHFAEKITDYYANLTIIIDFSILFSATYKFRQDAGNIRYIICFQRVDSEAARKCSPYILVFNVADVDYSCRGRWSGRSRKSDHNVLPARHNRGYGLPPGNGGPDQVYLFSH
jgi:hypothetical protein